MDYRTKPDLDEDLLVHFGVKGMRWGVRNGGTGSGGRSEVRKLKDQEKARKYQAKLDRNAAIDAARERVNSGAIRRDAKAAKAEYKAQKKVVGRREARKTLREKRRILSNEYALSQQTKSGKEMTATILLIAGASVLGGAAKGLSYYN